MDNPSDILRQMLMGGGGPQGLPGMDFLDTPGQGQPASVAEDPIMAMMQQMMGGAGGPNGVGIPSGLASMLNGGGGGGGVFPGQSPVALDPKAQIWRILHAVCALLLGLYTISSVTFSGSKVARDYADITVSPPPRLFWMFATMELVLQSTRFFLDGGHLPPSGILGTVGQFLPEPYAGYVRIFARYSVYYTALVADVSLVVFVLGVTAWWKGAVAA